MADEQLTNKTESDDEQGEGSFFHALKAVRKRRRRVNKARREADEVKFLNIVAMMDMMTILLVFLLKSVSFSSSNVTSTDAIQLPYSSTDISPPEAVKVYITKNNILVEDTNVAEVKDGQVVPKYLSSDNNLLITNLREALNMEIDRQFKLAKLGGKSFEMQGNLLIIADVGTWAQTVIQIFYTAGQATGTPTGEEKPSFSKYRLAALKEEM